MDSSAPPVVEIDVHGGVVKVVQPPLTTNNQHPQTTTTHQLPPVVVIDAHGGVESCPVQQWC